MITTYILISVIGIVYPSYIVLTHKKINNRIKINDKFRLVDYKQTISIFWILTILIISNSMFDNDLKLNFYPTLNTFGIITAILIIFFIGFLILQSKVKDENVSATKEKMIDGYHYLPKTRQELIWFNILSLSAGICEEIIFRMFVFSFLLFNTNLITSFLLTNIIFAITHIGTGTRNILSAFILGLLFTAIYYFTNNIWLSIILHCAIDIYAGAIGYKTEKAILNLKD